MKKSPLKQAAERREVAEHNLAVIEANTKAKALERSLALLEAPQPVTVPWSEYPAFDQFGSLFTGQRPYYWSSLEDRIDGRYRPVYENDQDLRVIRAAGRRFKSLFPVAEGALEALTNYTMKGLTVKVQPKNAAAEKLQGINELAAFVQRIVDKFLERNGFIDNLDREIHETSREEGETFIALYPDGDDRKEVRAELIDPDYILAPLEERPLNRMLKCDHKLNYWSHGVHTQFNPILKRDDVTRPLGYHAVFDRTGDQWDYLPAARVQHIKRNVGRSGRRGISDFFILMDDLEAEAKIRRNTAEGTAILAAIVEIRQYAEGTTKGTVENMARTGATSSYDRQTPNGTRSVNSQSVAPGTVRHVPAGQTSMLGSLGTLRSATYLEVGQYVLRTIWQRWNAPEYMSGDASNANLASTLVAESPFVRGREADQSFYGGHFQDLIWKALAMYHRAGKLGGYQLKTIFDLLSISVTMASPASRDKLAQAQANQIMYDAGVMSAETWQVDAGLKPAEERKKIAAEPPKPAPVMVPPLGPGHGSPAFGQKLESLAERALKRLSE